MTLTAIVLFGIVVFFNAIVSSRGSVRLDMTQDHIFTVSPAAKNILSHLRVPVQVTFYVTDRAQMPTALKTLEQDVGDKLREFEVASKGMLTYKVLDPSADEELAERIIQKGIRPFQVQSIEKDEIGLKRVYSAMEVSYLDKDAEIIPQVLPQSLETLEYEICSAVVKLTRDKDPVVAVYASRESLDPQMVQFYLQMGQPIPEPQDLYAQIPDILRSQNYDVRSIELTEASPIPAECNTLLIMEPKDLADRQRYEINAFLQRGGNVMIAVQRYKYDYNPSRLGGFDVTPREIVTGAGPLLEAYGLPVSDLVFLDNNMTVLSIPSTRNVGGLRLQVQEPVQKPVQITISQGQFNNDTSISNRIGELLFLWGSRLNPNLDGIERSDLEYTPLFFSSDQSWETASTGAPLTNADLVFNEATATPRAPLAALLVGNIPNAYENGNIPLWSDTDSVTTAQVEEFDPVTGKLLVVGCGRMFGDVAIQGANNGLLFLNCVDALTLGEDLIKVRAKSYTQRVIGPVGEEKKLAWRLFATVLVPVLVAAFGLARLIRRRREQSLYLAAQGG